VNELSSSKGKGCHLAGISWLRGLKLRLCLVLFFFIGALSCASTPPAPPFATTPPVGQPSQATQPLTPMPSPPLLPVEVTAPQPTGSLWSEGSRSLFQDIKATDIGDIITITVVEQATGSKAANTSTNRLSDLQGSFKFDGITTGGAKNPAGAFAFGPYQGQFSNKFSGNGTTSRTDTMSAYMTATVVDKLPNGNLVIRGSRWTKVNNDLQQIVLEGVIRPTDITRNNTVLSQNIADAKIFLVGKGPLAKQQKPGWLGQVLDVISPF
jgi:flagellar L-ring protein FlgH